MALVKTLGLEDQASIPFRVVSTFIFKEFSGLVNLHSDLALGPLFPKNYRCDFGQVGRKFFLARCEIGIFW